MDLQHKRPRPSRLALLCTRCGISEVALFVYQGVEGTISDRSGALLCWEGQTMVVGKRWRVNK
jgi:hypothetical protein